MWETLSEGMLGFVLIVDANEPQTFEDARGMISFFTEMSDVPFVVAANKVAADDVRSSSRCALICSSTRRCRCFP